MPTALCSYVQLRAEITTCVDGCTVGSNHTGDLGQNGWLPAMLLASLSGKVKEMSFKCLCDFKLNGESNEY